MEGITRFPITAIVGMDFLKTAYLANIINPKIGGLLISGPKGTGKSTFVHSVEDLLPEHAVVKDCVFGCDPEKSDFFCTFCKGKPQKETSLVKGRIIDLPLSCTEDRLLGSIDIEKILKEGVKSILPGLLAMAHRNILYIDEVNLLPDHLVDDILDVSALHWNVIEREGFSVKHRSDFILVGTMNPEEGELRPQILDRFPLCVRAESPQKPEERAEIVKRTLSFENDPDSFFNSFKNPQSMLKNSLQRSKELLKEVQIDEDLLWVVTKSCSELKVDGQRPDIIITKTAMTISALHERKETQFDDILDAALMTLCHRTRDSGLLEPPSSEEVVKVFRDNHSNLTREKPSKKSEKFSFNNANLSGQTPEKQENTPQTSQQKGEDSSKK
ncbi:magnesium chelatase ATPase subunit I [candidate division WOR-3 bacterium]|nr:magnesium chelatase ATPase subunit I [candidate division WOR-3 bacterium]